MDDTENVVTPVEAAEATKKATYDRYLRNRPFLVINTVRRPSSKARTNKAGWAEDETNWEVFEQPVLVDRVNAVHMRDATVIIDVMKAEVVKTRFADNSPEEVVNYYLNKYREQISEAMGVWLNNMSKKVAANMRREDELAAVAAKIDATYSAV